MKKSLFFLLLVLNLNLIHGYAQNNQFVIGPISDSIYHNTINQTVSFWGLQIFYLDINNDNINDFEFYAYEYGSSGTFTFESSLTSMDSTYFVKTTILDSVFYGGTWHPWPYDIVEQFDYGDTINNNYIYSTWDAIAYYYDNPNWPFIALYDYWIGAGYKYIGFKKIINGITYWGWIQIIVNDYANMTIKDYAFSDNIVSIKEDLLKNHVQIFPNPTSDIINIMNISINSYAISDYTGRKIINRQANMNFANSCYSIDVSKLKQGIYLLEINTDEGDKTFKFIKN